MGNDLKEIEISRPQNEVLTSTKQLNLFLAGVGSGKSHLMGLQSAFFVVNFVKARGLISANTYSQLSGATLARVFKVWKEYFGWTEDVHFVVDKQPPDHYKKVTAKLKTYKNVISFQNGASIFLASLDNYKAVDGIEVTYALLDETKDTKEAAVKEVVLARMRETVVFIDDQGNLYDYKPEEIETSGFNPLYVYTSPAKVQWLNEMFYINKNLDEINTKIFQKDDFYVGEFEDRKVVISSTYHNEQNLPSNYIESRRAVWDETPGMTDMLIFGSPMGKTGSEWYSKFEREVHIVDSIDLDLDLPLHVVFDFNVVPYMPAIVCQIVYEGAKTVIKIINEYALEHPNNTTMDVCNEIIFDYAGKVSQIYYYGDASGKNRTTSTTDKSIRHNYDVIESFLADFIYDDSKRVPRSNPPISGRRLLMNRIFSGNSDVSIQIDSSCEHMINDINFGKEGPNGEFLKEKVRDAQKGITYEKYGHHSDCLIYICWWNFNYLIKID